jgi:3'-5' exoribonuclease
MQAAHAQKGPWLRELVPGDQFVGFYILRNKQLEPFRDASRGYYLTVILQDRSGQLMGRVWEGGEELAEALQSGQVVKVQGEVETYLERVQARLLRIRPAEAGEYDRRDLFPSSRRDPLEMLAELQTFLDGLQNPHLHALVMAYYGDEDFMAEFVQTPAAKRIHHAYLGGLLEHILEMLTLVKPVCRLYPDLDADLLTAGALLHDLGKVREIAWEPGIDYTTQGRLLGHVTITDEMVNTALSGLPEFPAALALQVRHMLLAHHGRYEWGSLRRPMTLEAIALHQLDDLVAQINRFQLILSQRQAGEAWSGYDHLLGHSLYRADPGEEASGEARNME